MISPIHFLFCNLVISILLGVLLLIRRLGGRHLAATARYRLWYLFIAALFLPFCPPVVQRDLSPQSLFLRLRQLLSVGKDSDILTASAVRTQTQVSSEAVIRDFSAAVSGSGVSLSRILFVIWVIGMLAVSLYFAGSLWQVRRIRRRAFLITRETEPELFRLFSDCRRTLSLRRPVRLYASCETESPVSFGLIRPVVLIPQDLDILSTEKELRFIFLHELQHCRNQDGLLNLFICTLETLYWFNPFLWYGFGQMKRDREMACDHAVLGRIGREERIPYGLTILHFASAVRQGFFASPLSGIGSSLSATRQRIAAIAEYERASFGQKIKSAGLSALLFALIFCLTPMLSAYASGAPAFHLTDERWRQADVSDLFDGQDGAFVLYDMKNDTYQIYNKERCEQRYSPASTFKIYSGLFALEEGLIRPDASGLSWDGSAQPFAAWMQDQTLSSAMQNSVNWYFQNLDYRMGSLRLSSYYSRIGYGNGDISGGLKSYWADSSLQISPLEQVRLLAGLLSGDWDFAPENVQAIKDALLLSEDTAAGVRLYGKTGSSKSTSEEAASHTASDRTEAAASLPDSAGSGWFVGFVETSDNTFCFAVHLEGEGCDGTRAADTALSVLHRLLF